MEITEIKTLDDALAVIRQLLEIVKKQGDEIAKLREENEKLRQENAWLKRQIFGSRAERYIPTDDTPSLFPEDESPAQPEESPSTTVSGHERKVRQANALSEIPADLPREERVIDVPEDQRQGMKLIGYAESERIAYRTGLYVIHFKRAKYAAPNDALCGVVTAPAPGDVFDSASGRSRYDVSFVAKVVADKVENAIPLERQARMFGSEGLPVAPSTLEYPMMYHNVSGRFFCGWKRRRSTICCPRSTGGVRQAVFPACRGAGCAGSGRPPHPYNGLKLSVMRVMYHNVFGRKKPSRLGWLAFAFAALCSAVCRQGIRHRRLRL